MTALSQRDLAIIRLISRFKILTSRHIFDIVFTTTSRTPLDSSLRRLVADGFVVKMERALPGGARGGRSQAAYGLGRRGYWLIHDRGEGVEYRRPSIRDMHHTLAIADLYVLMHKLQAPNDMTIVGLATEPDCWVDFGTIELKPDLTIEYEFADGRRPRRFFEVDMATEGQKQVRGKLAAVLKAAEASRKHGWTNWYLTVWVCVDEERRKEVAWLVSQLDLKAQEIFRVCTLDTLPATLNLSPLEK